MWREGCWGELCRGAEFVAVVGNWYLIRRLHLCGLKCSMAKTTLNRQKACQRSETQAVKNNPIKNLFFSATPWLRGAKVLFLVFAGCENAMISSHEIDVCLHPPSRR